MHARWACGACVCSTVARAVKAFAPADVKFLLLTCNPAVRASDAAPAAIRAVPLDF